MPLNFDYVKERSFLDSCRASLFDFKDKLNEGKRINQERDRIVRKLDKAKEARRKLEIISKAYKYLNELVIAEDRNFKNSRLEFISDAITETLYHLFPDEGFEAKLVCDFNRGMKTNFILKDSTGRSGMVHISEGKLLQSQVSYAAATSIARSLSANKIYLDEAFAVSSPTNLSKISDITRKFIESGMQIFMIEQYSNGYKDLPRREIHLTKDPITKKVEKPVIIDY